MKPNNHKFNISLPMYPSQRIGDNEIQCEIKTDDEDLKGVTGLHVRASSNGFTNVVMEFEASAILQFEGALIAQINMPLNTSRTYWVGFDEVANQIPGSLTMLCGDEKMEFVKRILEVTMERIKRPIL